MESRIVGELNSQHIKLAKLKENLFGINMIMKMNFLWFLKENYCYYLGKKVVLKKNDCYIVPKGVEHKPIAEEEVSIMLFEPISTIILEKQKMKEL